MTFNQFCRKFIPDKTTISVVSWHQMNTRLTRFILDTRLALETRLILRDPASICDSACIRSFTALTVGMLNENLIIDY